MAGKNSAQAHAALIPLASPATGTAGKRALPWRALPWRSWRFVALAAAGIALLTGLQSGLLRLGWSLPGASTALQHGPLMICGFLGTLISLERAIAAAAGGARWAYAAPASAALGAIALASGYETLAQAAILAAGMLLLAVSVALFARMPAMFTGLLTVAAAAWGVGSLLWALGAATALASAWWLAFLVLTVAAERIELGRIAEPPRRSTALLVIGVGLILLGAARGELTHASSPAFGVGLLVVTGWLVRYDVARFTVRQRQQVRFSALCVLAGYVWLVVAGSLLATGQAGNRAFGYDAAVHAIAIGFVLSMIFAHAPTILPVIVGGRPTYTAWLYTPLALLHASLALRLAGDLFESVALRKWSGTLTVFAVLAYALTIMAASWRARRSLRDRMHGSD
jgi:hypothetical protein